MATDYFMRARGVLYSDIGGDYVALNVDKGRCYGLEDVAASIWSILAAPITIDQMCDQLVAEFEVDAEACKSDVTALIAELRDEGLITVSTVD